MFNKANFHCAPPKINMSPKKGPFFESEISIGTDHQFSGANLLLVFREGKLGRMFFFWKQNTSSTQNPGDLLRLGDEESYPGFFGSYFIEILGSRNQKNPTHYFMRHVMSMFSGCLFVFVFCIDI